MTVFFALSCSALWNLFPVSALQSGLQPIDGATAVPAEDLVNGTTEAVFSR